MKNIVISNDYELFHYIFSDVGDVINFPYDTYRNTKIKSMILYSLQKIPGIEKLISYIWNHRLLKEWRGQEKINAIIFLNPVLINKKVNRSLLNFLQQKNIIIILFVIDSMNNMSDKNRKRIVKYSSYFDKVYTFDLTDAKKFKWTYSLCYYSKLNYLKPRGEKTKTLCILYVKNTNRLITAIKLWDKLQSYNLKCFFVINGVMDKDVKKYYREGVVFNRYYSYLLKLPTPKRCVEP